MTTMTKTTSGTPSGQESRPIEGNSRDAQVDGHDRVRTATRNDGGATAAGRD